MNNRDWKKRIIEQLDEPYWQVDAMVIAVEAKKERRLKKNKGIFETFVLETKHPMMQDKYATSFREEFIPFLESVKNSLEKIQNNRFQIALNIKQDDRLSHWVSIDVKIQDGKPIFFIMDSFSGGWANDISMMLKKTFSDPEIYAFGYENPIQYDHHSCSRFTLNNIYISQMVDTFAALESMSIQKSADGVKHVNFSNLPDVLVKMIRPIQSLNAFEKDVPKSLKDLKLGKDKSLSKEISEHTRIVDKATQYVGKKQNKYIDYKKERFEKQISKFLNNTKKDIQTLMDKRSDISKLSLLSSSEKSIDSTNQKKYFLPFWKTISSISREENLINEFISNILKEKTTENENLNIWNEIKILASNKKIEPENFLTQVGDLVSNVKDKNLKNNLYTHLRQLESQISPKKTFLP